MPVMYASMLEASIGSSPAPAVTGWSWRRRATGGNRGCRRYLAGVVWVQHSAVMPQRALRRSFGLSVVEEVYLPVGRLSGAILDASVSRST